MNPADAVREVFEQMAEELEGELEGPAEDLDDFDLVLDYYGGTAGAAEAAGFGTAAEARAAGTTKAREAFMRRLRGYRQFEAEGRRPGSRARDWRRDPDSRALVEGMAETVRNKGGLEALADALAAEGYTVTVDAEIAISQDERDQDFEPPGWYVSARVAVSFRVPEFVGAGDWDALVDAFADAFSTSYLGGPGLTFLDIGYLAVDLGRLEGSLATVT